ncbi:MAG: NAD(P) transhydrogenase subunit alpha [Pseudomonadaceae bacterium]|nr:NAD(P) transhydrogenase subunit alpha [Pseudomonadaceae bacterium]
MELTTLTVLIMVFVLACVIGYFVVWGVTPALHTPLMAVTNAISGIVIVAAVLVAGPAVVDDAVCNAIACNPHAATLQSVAKILGFVAVALCAINIFGGFAITRRMLSMFRQKGGK